MKTVLISAGHTMIAPGAIHGEFREADLTRKIAGLVVVELQKLDVKVKAVPLDLPMLQRIQWINKTGLNEENGDICVEIHINDSDGSKRGIESWFKGKSGDPSQQLATSLNETICAITGYQNQGAHSEFEHELKSLTFINRTKPISILLETLYLDNIDDKEILNNDKSITKLAGAIAIGIKKYLTADVQQDTGEPKKKHPVQTSSLPQIQKPRPKPLSHMKPPAGGSSIMQDREQRKQTIIDNYAKILGREPSQTDLNYFLNLGVSEGELVKKMADSQEHADILKAKKELVKVKKELEKQEVENIRLKTTLGDQKRLLDEINRLIAHKNQAIRQLEKMIRQNHGLPSHVVRQTNAINQPKTQASKKERKSDNISSPSSKKRLFKYIARKIN